MTKPPVSTEPTELSVLESDPLPSDLCEGSPAAEGAIVTAGRTEIARPFAPERLPTQTMTQAELQKFQEEMAEQDARDQEESPPPPEPMTQEEFVAMRLLQRDLILHIAEMKAAPKFRSKDGTERVPTHYTDQVDTDVGNVLKKVPQVLVTALSVELPPELEKLCMITENELIKLRVHLGLFKHLQKNPKQEDKAMDTAEIFLAAEFILQNVWKLMDGISAAKTRRARPVTPDLAASSGA